MEKNSIGFFRKFILSITEQRIFPYVVKESVWSAIGYFIKLLLLVCLALSIYATSLLFEALPSFIDKVEKKMPYFEIVDGRFSVDKTSGDNFELTKSMYLFLLDEKSDVVEKRIKDLEKDYEFYINIDSEKITIYNETDNHLINDIYEVNFKTVVGTNKDVTIKEWRRLSDSITAKLFVIFSFMLVIFGAYSIYRAFTLIMYVILVYIMNMIFMAKLRFKDKVKIAIYISTLPIVLETMAFLIAGNLPDVANFVNSLISMVYVFYALRAIKLDSILSTVIGNTPEEKIRNAIINAQNELKEQIKELEEEKKKKLDENSNENHTIDDDSHINQVENDEDNIDNNDNSESNTNNDDFKDNE